LVSADAVTRDQFWSIVSLRGFPYPSANRLYSCFDADHTGVMDYRFLMASLRALRRPHEDTIAKMTAMFRYFLPDDDASAAVPRSDVIACLQLACSTDEDRKVLQQLIVEALQSRLGLKSLWARDVTRFYPHRVNCVAPALNLVCLLHRMC
jgi:Ca2+-binding EF-hand superfamily protein